MMTDQPQPPKRSAEEVLRSHPPQPPVRRLRPGAVAILLGGLALVFGGRLLISMLDQQADRTDDELTASRMRARDDMLERGPIGQLPSDYSFLPQPAKPKPEPVVAAPPPEPEPPPAELDPETRRRLAALRKEREEAMDSPVGFPDVWTVHRTNVPGVPGSSGLGNHGGAAAFGDQAGEADGGLG